MTDLPEPPDGVYPDGNYVVSPKIISQATARKFIGQNSRGYMAIGIIDETGNPVDPDPATLELKVYLNTFDGTATDPRGNLIADVNETTGVIRDDIGKFHYDIGPTYTAQKGTLTAEWDYGANSLEFTFIDNMQILDQMPTYDSLADESKVIVERASWFFGDLFDSTAGGPWLAENFQTHFNYERIAQLMHQAVLKLNTTGFPVTSYGVAADDPVIPANFTGLATWATKLEIIRHLSLSYTEQPLFQNMQITYTDRRDYAQRWQTILAEEEPQFEKAVKMSKRSLLSLGHGSLLVAGGIFGGTAGRSFFVAGMYTAQVRAFRFYPASPSSMWSAQAFGGR
jgi:hypothetical protein